MAESDEDVLPAMSFSDSEDDAPVASSASTATPAGALQAIWSRLGQRQPRHAASSEGLAALPSAALFEGVTFAGSEQVLRVADASEELAACLSNGMPCLVLDAAGCCDAASWSRLREAPMAVCTNDTAELRPAADESSPALAEAVLLQSYEAYAAASEADWPFSLRADVPRPLVKDAALEAFSSSAKVSLDQVPDLYQTSPAFGQWLPCGTLGRCCMVGSRLSGLPFRRSPGATTLCTSMLEGSALWSLLPATVTEQEMAAAGFQDRAPAAWWKDRAATGAVLAKQAVDVHLKAGETLVVPAGWWYCFVHMPNDEERVAVSLQACGFLATTLPHAWPQLRVQAPKAAVTLRRAVSALQARSRDELLQLMPGCPEAGGSPALLPSPQDSSYVLRRVHFSELTVAEFRLHHCGARLPLIITGLAPFLASEASMQFSVDYLRWTIPSDLAVPVKHPSADVTDMPFGVFLRLLEKGEPVYAADISIANYFPWLFDHIRVPRYFLHDFCHRTRIGNIWSNMVPSVFIGGAGTRSKLHIDQLASSFFMFLAEGRKRWVTFHPDDVGLLSGEWDEDEQITRFRDLDELRRDEACCDKLNKARCLDFVLEDGEVLFIPHGTPHQVENLTRTVAISGNFFDQTNLEPALQRMDAKLSRLDAGSARHKAHADLRDGLAEMDWPSISEDLDADDQTALSGEKMVGWFSAHERLRGSRPLSFKG
eukprot:TRINITY_DN11009_c0_g1_i2.p1 TRINITY_DN11009_c0_g1~~TRINITY_DN11009_c0_g1_i2.p1  ORF type:complete len:734 (-),score=136.39 TRINITY_DN11009_c0_g1_i2:100-2235(-)